ncbi:MAG: tetratricopeptide repeat protein [Candidatus Scalindua sediminis]|nr:tetratricopeptide repeat protein [Candidatus Scalindua sediminis]
MKKLPRILIYFSILIAVIFLSVSIARDYVAHVYLSEYKSGLKEKRQDTGRQGHLLRRSLELSPSNAETLFELGRFYVNEKHIGKSRKDRNKSYELAKGYFQEALIRKPTDGRNRATYAWHIGNKGKTNEAIEHFNEAINLGSTDAYLHMIYAMWCVNQVKKEINFTNTVQFVEKYRDEQKRDETLKSYDKRSINGVSIATFLRTGQEEWDKALSLGTRRNRAAYNSIADLNLLRYELDKAIGNYNRANNNLMLTRCYIIKGDYNRSVKILGFVIKGGGTPFWGNLAIIKKLLMFVIDTDPKNYQSFYWLGETHTRLRKTEKAILNFKTTVQLNPKHIDAHLNLAKLYNQTGKIDLAIEEYETILEQDPNHKEATRLLGEAIRSKYKDAEFLIKP